MKKFWKIFFLFIFFSGISLQALSEDIPAGDKGKSKRPKVGVVLAGGGAKGSAHIGVLKYLEEIGIPVDYVAGTSMGSIIGGLYALGYTPIEMDSLISHLDWSVYMSDAVNRADISSEDKIRRSTYLLTVPFNTPASFKKNLAEDNETRKKERAYRKQLREQNTSADKSFISSLPSGFISGNNLLNLFNNLCVGYQDSISFDRLPIPYACVATDVVTGQQVVLRSGKFPEAMRASMAIPGVFAPVKMNGKLLVDGGMVNNFPTDVCKAMGADIIIGVEVSTGLKTDQSQLNSLPELLGQLMGIVTMGHNDANQKLCDVYIHPDITGYGTMSFDKKSIDTLIQRGYNAAMAKENELVALKDKLVAAGRGEKHLNAPPAKNLDNDTISIASVAMEGLKPKDSRWLLGKSGLLNKKNLTGADINKAIALFYGTNCFSAINYYLERDPRDTTSYHLAVKFKPAEPHVFGFGFRFDSEETAAILLKVGFNEKKLTGVRFNIAGRLSYNPWATAVFTVASRKFPKFNIGYTFRKSEMTLYYDGNMFANTHYYRHTVDVNFSESHSRYISTALGVRYDHFQFTRMLANVTDSTNGKFTTDYMRLYGRFAFDNLDKAYFATKGVRFSLRGEWFFKTFTSGYDDYYGTVQLNFESFFSMFKEKLTIIPQLYFRTLIGPIASEPIELYNFIGGSMPGRFYEHQLPFVGSNHPQLLLGGFLSIARVDFRVNVHSKHYLKAICNYARNSFDIKQFFTNDLVGYSSNYWGAALEYLYDSPIGPLSLNVNWSNLSKKVGLYVNIGYYF